MTIERIKNMIAGNQYDFLRTNSHLQMNAILVELDYKGVYERYVLTPEEFDREFPGVLECNENQIIESGTYTIKPLVHIWYCPCKIGDKSWTSFFTYMEDGLPDSDVNSGNIAYVSIEKMRSLRNTYVNWRNNYENFNY